MDEVTLHGHSLAPPRERLHSVLWVLRLFAAMRSTRCSWGILRLLKPAVRGERPERWRFTGCHS